MKPLFAALLLFTSLTSFAEIIPFEKPSEWVTPVEQRFESKFSKYDINNGMYNPLIDYQYNLKTKESYYHTSTKITTDAGVSSGSELYISYDSSYQSVSFHHLYIWRNGKKIDKTQEITFELINNEQNLQYSIYSGLVTAYDVLTDVRKNDIIEYAYTVKGANPVFDNYSFLSIPLEDTNPIDFLSIKIIYPESSNPKYECTNCQGINIKEKSTEGYNTIQITRKDVEAVDIEETIPSWVIPYAYFSISDYKDWEQVGNWAEKLFTILPEEDEKLNLVLQEVLNGGETEIEKVNAILNYVQNNIRYMGMENGIGSFKPFAPSQVAQQRYGDCKDKSLLFVSLLNKIGIKSCFPALVSTNFGEHLSETLPAGQNFDHCIVYLEYSGQEYWLDPTIGLQGGNFMTRKIPDYGEALIVRNGVSSLAKMNIKDTDSRTEMTEVLNLPSFNSPGTLEVTTTLYGLNADTFRQVLEYYSTRELSSQLKSIYGVIFPNIEEVERVKIEDNEEENILIVKEFYKIYDCWEKVREMGMTKNTFQYEPISLYQYVSPMECETKEHPVSISYPSDFSLTTTITLPDFILVEKEKEEYNNDGFYFAKNTWQTDTKTIHVSYEFRTIAKEVKAKNFRDVCSDLNSIAKNLPLQVYFSK